MPQARRQGLLALIRPAPERGLEDLHDARGGDGGRARSGGSAREAAARKPAAARLTPRGLTREQAALYCGCETVEAFDSWVRRGIVPGPIRGTHRWDRKATITPSIAARA